MYRRDVHRLRPGPAALLVLLLSALGSCGTLGLQYVSNECSEACDRLYHPDYCYLQRPGYSQDDMVDTCVVACSEAEEHSGGVGDYQPYSLVSDPASVELENAAQVEAWTKCISETTCQNLDAGYCAPVW